MSSMRRQDENSIVPKRGYQSHTIASSKGRITSNENALSKNKLGSATIRGKTLNQSMSDPFKQYNEKEKGNKLTAESSQKPSISAAPRAPLTSKVQPARLVPSGKPPASNSTKTSSASYIKVAKVKSKIPSHVSGGRTPIATSRSAHAPSGGPTRTAQPIKSALNVYTPGPAKAAPSASKVRSAARDHEDDAVEYMPPPVIERPYEPASIMSLRNGQDEDLFAPQPQSDMLLEFNPDLEPAPDLGVHGGPAQAEELNFNDSAAETEYLFDV